MKETITRWTFFSFGLIVLAFGISLTIKGKAFGIGPWDVFHYGLYKQLGLTIGVWSIIVGFILLGTYALLTKRLPKIGAFINMIVVGLFIDIFSIAIPTPSSMLLQAIVFGVGIIILSYGVGLYVAADLGAGPRDSFMLVIVEKTNWPIQWVRNGIELAALFFGWLLGGPVGIGTLVIAMLIGPLISVSLPQSKALLNMLIHSQASKSVTEKA